MGLLHGARFDSRDVLEFPASPPSQEALMRTVNMAARLRHVVGSERAAGTAVDSGSL